ncbi:hypothetical protein T484DRAFT_1817689 [Baffinella frigidus]|nr:hypothetical protein T484DRAFT_1817689 [Cryptophyta sp. CCMP2293]
MGAFSPVFHPSIVILILTTASVHSFNPSFLRSPPAAHRTFSSRGLRPGLASRLGGAVSQCRMLQFYIDPFSHKGIEFCVGLADEGATPSITVTYEKAPLEMIGGRGKWVGGSALSQRGEEWQRSCEEGGGGVREVGEMNLFQISKVKI